MTWFVSNSPLANAGEPQDEGLNIRAFSDEGEAKFFAGSLRAVGGSSILIYVECRRAGKTVRKIGPDQIDAWIDED